MGIILPNPKLRQSLHNRRRLQDHTDHFPDQAHDILRVVAAARFVDDAAKFASLGTRLVDHPVEDCAAAEAEGEWGGCERE